MNFDPQIGGNGPFRTPAGTLFGPYGRVVAYVRATRQDSDDANIENLRCTTLAQGLQRCVAGRNDIVIVLPGHTENISTGTYLSATGILKSGAQVIGLGQGTTRPTFTFTATGSQWLVNQPNVLFHNLLFNTSGVSVTIGFDITGANVTFSNCEIVTSVAAANRFANVMRLSAGADDFTMSDCILRGNNAANGAVDNILVNATVARARFLRNNMSLGVTVATIGLIRFAAIATDCLVKDNVMRSTLATSSTILDFDAAATGLAANNVCSIGSNQAAGTGFTVGTSGFYFHNNLVTGVVDTSGYLSPAADT